MPRQANGNYIAPANTAAVSGTSISATAFNTLETDIGTEITNSLDRLGRSAMQAALPMGNNNITGMADPVVSTDAATKNYVDTVVASFFSTGDVKLTYKSSPDTGWLMFDDGTFGSVSSGSSNSNSAANLALFTLLFNTPFTDANVPLLTSGGAATTRSGQVSASAAWAANCRMSLPKTLGRALGIAGAGSGLTTRVLGSIVGEEAHTLTLTELATGITSGGSISGSATNALNIPQTSGSISSSLPGSIGGSGDSPNSPNTWSGVNSFPVNGSASVTSNNTGGGAHNNMPPMTYLNAMIKV